MNKFQKIQNNVQLLKKGYGLKNQVDLFDDVFIIIHHTAGGTMQSISQSHKGRFYDTQKLKQEIGKVDGKITDFPYIAYHYIILRDGTIYQNRGHDQIGYHASNWYVNSRSIAISFDGNYENIELNTKQIESLKKILTKIKNQYNKPIKIYGHKDVSSGYTACPGKNIYKLLSTFENGKMEQKKSFYREIYEKEFGETSTIYSNLKLAIEQLGINTTEEENKFYFFLIGLERLNKENKEKLK